MTRLFWLSVVTVVSTYALIVFGGITRVSGSGMGCEDDWPLCQGKPYPPLDTIAIIEYLHRTIASAVGLMVLAMVVLAWRLPGLRRATRYLTLFAFALIIVQGLLGAVTVWQELPASIVTAHLGTSMLFLATTMLITWFVAVDRGGPRWLADLGAAKAGAQSDPFWKLAAVAGVLVYVVILSGGSTSSSGAALACDEWPLCLGGEMIPDRTSKYTWINLGHRAIAGASVIAMIWLLVAVLRRRRPEVERRLAIAGAALVIAQAGIGAVYVFTDGSDWMSAIHLAAATLLWAGLVTFALVAGLGTMIRQMVDRPHSTLGVPARGGAQ